ncbi:MAG: arylsulfatase [Planctomycetota bacterium]
MRTATAGLLLLASTGPAAAQAGPVPSRPPNIVYILADDLGYGELGCYGQQRIRTTNLDRLAAQGMRFTQHYSGAPVCAPSRCVLMTGRHSGHATIRDNQEHRPEGQAPIAAADVTIAEVLRGHGYRSGAFGKWGLGFPGGEGDPLRQGFDRFFGYNCQRQAHNFYPRYLWSDDRKVELEGNDRGATGAQYAHDVITAQAIEFVRAHRDAPFFLFVPFTLPHLALQVPEESLAEYRGRWPETPYEGKSYLPHPTPRACYAAMITHLDKNAGQLLDELDALGLAADTLVVFSSDNGPTHLNPQVDVEFFGSAGGLRGLKGSVYEGGIRVPMIARWPGRIAPGTVTDHVSAFQDVLPTLAALAGAEPPADCDGISFAPILRGEPTAQAEHAELLWDFPGYGGQLAMRAGDWKAVRRGLRKDPDAPIELYDLAADPGEQRDAAADHPERAAAMAARMVALRTRPALEPFRFGRYADDPAPADGGR